MLDTENCSGLCANKKEVTGMGAKVEYKVLNKEKLSGKKLKDNTQVRIEGKGYKAGEIVKLNPSAHDTKYLIGQGWLEPVEKQKAKVKLDDDGKGGK